MLAKDETPVVQSKTLMKVLLSLYYQLQTFFLALFNSHSLNDSMRLRVSKGMVKDCDNANGNRFDYVWLNVSILVLIYSLNMNLLLIGTSNTDYVVVSLLPFHIDSSFGHNHCDRLRADLVFNVDCLENWSSC